MAASAIQTDGNYRAVRFWYGAVVLIGVAAIFNFIWRLTLWKRIRASRNSSEHSVAKRSIISAKLTSLGRVLWYYQATPVTVPFWIKVPPFGSIYIILAYFVFIVILEFVYIDIEADQYWRFLAFRAAWIALAQLPLLVLLAGKNNLIGLVTGISYERLNIYHRWVARGVLLLITFHFAFISTYWVQTGTVELQWNTRRAARTGMAAYGLLLWINVSTLAPFRHFSYEFFLVQHVLTFFGFIIAAAYHIPAKYALTYIYIPSALYLTEKIIYAVRFAWNNIRPGHVTLEELDGRVIRLRVSSSRVKTWASGTHALLMIPKFGLLQSHPATIMSTPSSHGGDMVFLLRAYEGITKRFLHAAQGNTPNTSAAEVNKTGQSTSAAEVGVASNQYLTLINGPYGSSYADFACFESVLLIAGATGVTFTMGVLLDLAERIKSAQTDAESGRTALPLRAISFVWIIRERSWFNWISSELQSVEADLAKVGFKFSAHIYITKDSALSAMPTDTREKEENDESQATTMLNTPDVGSLNGDAVNEEAVAREQSSVVLRGGRPVLDDLFKEAFDNTEGECAVTVCGPLGLARDVRSKSVAFNTKSHSSGLYMHVENFS